MAPSPGVVRTTDSSLVSVSPLVAQRHLGAGAGAVARGRHHDLEVRPVGWDDKQSVVRRLGKSPENTTTSPTGWLQVTCIATTVRHLSTSPPAHVVLAACQLIDIANRAERGNSDVATETQN